MDDVDKTVNLVQPPERKPFSALESIFANALGEVTLKAAKLEEELERQQSALTITSEEGNEIIGELSAALAVLASVKPCVSGCPGHLKEKAKAAVREALGRWTALEEERDRLRALVVRQQALLEELADMDDPSCLSETDDCPACEVGLMACDPDYQKAAAWLTGQIEVAREEGRQDVAELAARNVHLRALVGRQRKAISRAWNVTASATHSCSMRDAVLAALKDSALLPYDDHRQEELAEIERWLEAEREAARQEIRETAEYRAGAGLREAAEKTRGWERERYLDSKAGYPCHGYEQHPETGMVRGCSLIAGHAGPHEHRASGSLQTGGIAGEKDPNVPEDPRPYFAENPLTEEETQHGQAIAGLAPDGLVE